MNYKPILFSGEMVRAILDDRKNQTRRIVKPQPEPCGDGFMLPLRPDCPFGYIGDRLWVRETFTWDVLKDQWLYKANLDTIGADERFYPLEAKWKPSIFMPREASRITLEITEIRVERLLDISEEDAIEEGIKPTFLWTGVQRYKDYLGNQDDKLPIGSFHSLWDSINGKKHPWKSNPWVWVIKFKKLSPEEV